MAAPKTQLDGELFRQSFGAVSPRATVYVPWLSGSFPTFYLPTRVG